MDLVLKDRIKTDQMDLVRKDQTDHAHKGKIQMSLVQMDQTKMGHVLKDQTKTDQMGLVRKDQTKTDQMGHVLKDQTKTDLDQIMARVQIMMLDLRDLIQMGLVLKMETTHKKKTSKLRGLFFMRP